MKRGRGIVGIRTASHAFQTSLGVPADFADESFRRVLLNAITRTGEA